MNDSTEYKSFLQKAEEHELQGLMSVSDKYNSFTYNDADNETNELFHIDTWGNAIENNIIRQVDQNENNNGNQSTYELPDESYRKISEFLSKEHKENNEVDSTISDYNITEVKFNRKDKIAISFVFIPFLGLIYTPIGDIIYSLLNVFLSPLSTIPFFISILMLAFMTSLWSTYIQKKKFNYDLDEYKDAIHDITGSKNIFANIPEDTTKAGEEIVMKARTNMIKAQMKPFIWIVIITIPVLVWLFTEVRITEIQTIIFPLFGEIQLTSTIVGPIQIWILWYVINSITYSQLLNKTIGAYFKNE